MLSEELKNLLKRMRTAINVCDQASIADYMFEMEYLANRLSVIETKTKDLVELIYSKD